MAIPKYHQLFPLVLEILEDGRILRLIEINNNRNKRNSVFMPRQAAHSVAEAQHPAFSILNRSGTLKKLAELKIWDYYPYYFEY